MSQENITGANDNEKPETLDERLQAGIDKLAAEWAGDLEGLKVLIDEAEADLGEEVESLSSNINSIEMGNLPESDKESIRIVLANAAEDIKAASAAAAAGGLGLISIAFINAIVDNSEAARQASESFVNSGAAVGAVGAALFAIGAVGSKLKERIKV